MSDQPEVKEQTEQPTDYDTIAQAHGNAARRICEAIDAKLAELGDTAPPRLAEIRAEAAQGAYSQYFSTRYRNPIPALAQALVDAQCMDLYQRLLMGDFNAGRDEVLKYQHVLAGGRVYGDKAHKGRRVRIQ